MSEPHVFGISVPRLEDADLLRGRGRFVDDIRLPGMLEGAFLRSPHPHATIRGIVKDAALALPGVRAVYTLADLMPHLTTERLKVEMPSPSYQQHLHRPALAIDEVVYVGEPIAFVVADSRYIAEDAVALIDVEYDVLPAAVDCRAALAGGAPKVHRDGPHNLLAEFDMEYGRVDEVFATAPKVFRDTLWQHRGGSHSIECRGIVAAHEAIEDKLTVWSSTQTPHICMRMLADMLGLDENRIRVIAPDLGGGFGPKLVFYPEEVVVALAALLLARPVKWIEDRREHFVATTQERDEYWDMEIAVDGDGRILALRGAMIHDHGAYTARGLNVAQGAATAAVLAYEVPAYRLNVKVALTNKVPVTPVRGAGQPQGVFVMERLLDRVARELSLDRAEVRRRNLIPGEKMPYTKPLKTRGGMAIVLDSGDYPRCQQLALERAQWADFPRRQQAARAEGRHIGIGVANYVEGTGRGPYEAVTVRMAPSGKVQIYTGATAMGQGTRTMLAQIVAEQLGGKMEHMSVTTGDTAGITMGFGGFNSRQAVMAGSSAHAAAVRVRKKALTVAADMLHAPEAQLDIIGDQVRVKGTSDRFITFADLSRALAGTAGFPLPGGDVPGLEATEHVVIHEMSYANGTAVAEVEVDIETGGVRILRFVMVHDCGRPINPLLVEGQILGGIAHGIGNALFEWMGYDPEGQPVTTNLGEYLLVTSTEMPRIEVSHDVSPTPLNELGVKGVGEAGVIPTAPAIISAIEDALTPFGVRISQTPIFPAHIVGLLNGAKAEREAR
jgi:aerobic carbon-monoxide dehydrogenase large subunit